MVRKLLFLFLLAVPAFRLEAFEPVASRMSESLRQTLVYGNTVDMISVIV
jgi:hypothetical protein